MVLEITILIILWLILSLLVFFQYGQYTKDLSVGDRFVFCIICLIGGPIFAAANILEALLNCILPEGWGDEDGFGA
jgi:hypothetical protein